MASSRLDFHELAEVKKRFRIYKILCEKRIPKIDQNFFIIKTVVFSVCMCMCVCVCVYVIFILLKDLAKNLYFSQATPGTPAFILINKEKHGTLSSW